MVDPSARHVVLTRYKGMSPAARIVQPNATVNATHRTLCDNCSSEGNASARPGVDGSSWDASESVGRFGFNGTGGDRNAKSEEDSGRGRESGGINHSLNAYTWRYLGRRIANNSHTSNPSAEGSTSVATTPFACMSIPLPRHTACDPPFCVIEVGVGVLMLAEPEDREEGIAVVINVVSVKVVNVV